MSYDGILEDRRISAKSIAEQLSISRERVGSTIHEDLDMRKVTKGVLFLHDNPPAHRALAAQKKLACLGFQFLLFSGSGPVGLPPVPWTEKTIERSPFFVRGEVIHIINPYPANVENMVS
jgi:hypothetical protein